MQKANTVGVKSQVCLGFVLIAFLVGPHQTSADSPESLEAIARLQMETGKVLDTLSYEATVETATLESFSPEPFRQTVDFRFSRRGTTLLISRVESKVVEEHEQRENGRLVGTKFVVREDPSERRFLLTDEYLLHWPDTSEPIVYMRRADDWATNPQGYQKNAHLYWSVAGLKQQCLGPLNPFHALLKMSPEFTRWRHTERDDNTFEVKRELTTKSGSALQDLTLVLSQKDGLLHSSRFVRGNRHESTCQITYGAFERGDTLVRVPKTYVMSVKSGSQGEIVEETRITYSNFHDESTLPGYALDALKMPEGCEVVRELSPSGYRFYEWRGAELVEVSQSRSMRARSR